MKIINDITSRVLLIFPEISGKSTTLPTSLSDASPLYITILVITNVTTAYVISLQL